MHVYRLSSCSAASLRTSSDEWRRTWPRTSRPRRRPSLTLSWPPRRSSTIGIYYTYALTHISPTFWLYLCMVIMCIRCVYVFVYVIVQYLSAITGSWCSRSSRAPCPHSWTYRYVLQSPWCISMLTLHVYLHICMYVSIDGAPEVLQPPVPHRRGRAERDGGHRRKHAASHHL